MQLNGYTFYHDDHKHSRLNYISGIGSGISGYSELYYSGLGGLYSLIPDGLIYLDQKAQSSHWIVQKVIAPFMKGDPFGSVRAYNKFIQSRNNAISDPKYNRKGVRDWELIKRDFNSVYTDTAPTLKEFKKSFDYKSVDNTASLRRDLGIQGQSGLALSYSGIHNHAFFDFFTNMVEINQHSERANVLHSTIMNNVAKNGVDGIGFNTDMAFDLGRNFNFFKEFQLRQRMAIPYGKNPNFFKDYCTWQYSSTKAHNYKRRSLTTYAGSPTESDYKNPNFPPNFYETWNDNFNALLSKQYTLENNGRYENKLQSTWEAPKYPHIDKYEVLNYTVSRNTYNGPYLFKKVFDTLFSNNSAKNDPYCLDFYLLSLSTGFRPVWLTYFVGREIFIIETQDDLDRLDPFTYDFTECRFDNNTSYIVAEIKSFDEYVFKLYPKAMSRFFRAMEQDENNMLDSVTDLLKISEDSLFDPPYPENFGYSDILLKSLVEVHKQLFTTKKYLAFTKTLPKNANKYKITVEDKEYVYDTQTCKIEPYSIDMELAHQNIYYIQSDIEFIEANKTFGILSFSYTDLICEMTDNYINSNSRIAEECEPHYGILLDHTRTGFAGKRVPEDQIWVNYQQPLGQLTSVLKRGLGTPAYEEMTFKNPLINNVIDFTVVKKIVNWFYKFSRHTTNEQELDKFKHDWGFDPSLRNITVDNYLAKYKELADSIEIRTKRNHARSFGGVVYNFLDPFCVKVLDQEPLYDFSRSYYVDKVSKDTSKKAIVETKNREDDKNHIRKEKISSYTKDIINKPRAGIDFRNKIFKNEINIGLSKNNHRKITYQFNNSLVKYLNSQYQHFRSSLYSFIPEIKNLLPTVKNGSSDYSIYYIDGVSLHNPEYSSCEYWYRFFEREFPYAGGQVLKVNDNTLPADKNIFLNTKNMKIGMSWRGVFKLDENIFNYDFLVPYLATPLGHIIPTGVYEPRFFILPASGVWGKPPDRILPGYKFNYERKRYETTRWYVRVSEYFNNELDSGRNNNWILFIRVNPNKSVQIYAVNDLRFFNETAQYELDSGEDSPWGVTAYGCNNVSWNRKSYSPVGWYPASMDLIQNAIEQTPQDTVLNDLAYRYSKFIESKDKSYDISEADYNSYLASQHNGYRFYENLVVYYYRNRKTSYKHNHFWVRARPCFALPLDPMVINTMTYQNKGNLINTSGCLLISSLFTSGKSFFEDKYYKKGYKIGVGIRAIIDFFTAGINEAGGLGFATSQAFKQLISVVINYYSKELISYISTKIRDYMIKHGISPLIIGLTTATVSLALNTASNFSVNIATNLFSGKSLEKSITLALTDTGSYSSVINNLNQSINKFVGDYTYAASFFTSFTNFKIGLTNKSIELLLNKQNDKFKKLLQDLTGKEESETYNVGNLAQNMFNNIDNNDNFETFISNSLTNQG